MNYMNYRIIKRWDDLHARYEYTLQQLDRYKIEYEDLIYSGDEDWANRQAEHYKCRVVDETVDN